MSDINIKRHGAPIPFYGHQDGEIAVAVASSDSVNSPVHEGYVLVTTALGTLAKSSDCARRCRIRSSAIAVELIEAKRYTDG